MCLHGMYSSGMSSASLQFLPVQMRSIIQGSFYHNQYCFMTESAFYLYLVLRETKQRLNQRSNSHEVRKEVLFNHCHIGSQSNLATQVSDCVLLKQLFIFSVRLLLIDRLSLDMIGKNIYFIYSCILFFLFSNLIFFALHNWFYPKCFPNNILYVQKLYFSFSE